MLEEIRYRVRGLVWLVAVAAHEAREWAEAWVRELERRGRQAHTRRRGPKPSSAAVLPRRANGVVSHVVTPRERRGGADAVR